MPPSSSDGRAAEQFRAGRDGSAVAAAAAEAYPRIVATLIRVTGDWTLAEDSAQDALAAALERWPVDGVPGNPGGWLMTVARNRAVDVLRRASVEQRKLRDLAVLAPAEPSPDALDDRLRLIFTCCHPALPLEARVALTLRTICAVPTADIARAFLVTESAMTRRLTRAKTKIATAASRTGCRPAGRSPNASPASSRCCTCCSPRATTPPASPRSPRRRSAWCAWSSGSCPASRRCRRCWRCSCSSTRAGTPAATPPAGCSPSTGRTGPGGTTPPSPRAPRSWRGSRPRVARIRCRRTSRRATPPPRPRRTPTGRGSPAATTGSPPRSRRR